MRTTSQTARAKGLRDVQVRNRHAVRNAMLPTTTIIALNLGFVVSGAITIETVFSIPGLGLLTDRGDRASRTSGCSRARS